MPSVQGKGQTDALVACHACDALHRRPGLPEGGVVFCQRCGAELYREHARGLTRPLALTVAGLILFLITNSHPLLILKFGGRMQGNTPLAGVEAMMREGMWDLAALVFGTSICFPLLTLLGLLAVLLPLQFGSPRAFLGPLFRLINILDPWAMLGVYLLGILVAYVKLTSMASVVPGVGMAAFFGLILVTAAARASLDPSMVWRRIPVSS